MAVIVSKPNLAALNAFAMTKSELIERITTRQAQLSAKDVELAVKTMIEHMAQTLAQGHRIEIRGFGSFSLHYRAPRIGRNPKTGESVGLSGKYVPHFKPGKELRDRVNESLIEFPTPAVQNTRKPTRDARAPRFDGDD
jgi:integration host factor subunit beta